VEQIPPSDMAHHILESPSTELGNQTRMMTTADELEFSIEPSFVPPAGRDNLFGNSRPAARSVRTPSARNTLAALRQNPPKSEFTPLLKSATANRARQVNGGGVGPLNLNGKPKTPAALKPGYNFENSPALPEASFDAANSSSLTESRFDETSVPPAVSSSVVSTPMAMPRRDGEGAMDGNVLTLREQEEVRHLTTLFI
jgi:hypothetical protein